MTNDINTVTTVTTSLLFLKEGEDRGSIEKVRKGGEVVTNDDGEQGPDTDGLGTANTIMWGVTEELIGAKMIHELQARIARKEAANEALVQRVFALEAKHEATMADMRSLQRQNENWRAECHRLSAELIEAHRQLAQLMAIPANALRYGGVR